MGTPGKIKSEIVADLEPLTGITPSSSMPEPVLSSLSALSLPFEAPSSLPAVRKRSSRKAVKAVPEEASTQAPLSLSLCGAGESPGADRSAYDVLKDIQEVTRQAFAGGDIRTALKGLEMEAKHMGMLEDKIDAKVSIRTWMDCIARDEQFQPAVSLDSGEDGES